MQTKNDRAVALAIDRGNWDLHTSLSTHSQTARNTDPKKKKKSYLNRREFSPFPGMDSLIPFTTSGSLVDCVDRTSQSIPGFQIKTKQPIRHVPPAK